MSNAKIEELTRVLAGKEQEIAMQRQRIQQIKAQNEERQTQISVLDRENTTLLDNVPNYFRNLRNASIPKKHATTNQEEDEEYIKKQINAVDELEQRYISKFIVDDLPKQQKLLIQIQKLLVKDRNNFPKAQIEELVNNTGIVRIVTNTPQKSGFNLLLKLLEINSDNYSWFNFDSTKNTDLFNALDMRINALEHQIAEDERALAQFELARNQLSQLKIKVYDNHIIKAQLTAEMSYNLEEMTRIEEVIIKSLTDECQTLTQQRAAEQRQFDAALANPTAFQQPNRVQRHPSNQATPQHANAVQEEQSNIGEQYDRLKKAREIKRMLSNYQTQRDNHYQIKDSLFSGDKKNRDSFIKLIGGELTKYFVSGQNNDDLLRKITENIDAFPGVKMQATLNRIIVELMSTGYQPYRAEEAKRILSQLQTKHNEYVDQMKTLYEKIDAIGSYANTLPEHEAIELNELVDQLKNELDQFICSSPNSIPTDKQFDPFAMKFKARLHSKDDVLSNHKSSWGVIVTNIVLSVATLCKLAYSKITTGRASFFFDQTEKQKEIEADIEEALDDLELCCINITG